jgi:methionine sulfoxide reductase heme-binding subunit
MNLAWYIARAGGMVAFGLITASVLLGILLAGRKTLSRWPRFAVEDVHRFAGTLAWTFIGVHVAGLLVDTYIGFSLREVLIPFTSSYRPAATSAGIVAAELLAAIGITNRLKERIASSFWRRAHYLNFAVWALSLVHGVTAGSDTDAGWAQLLYLASAASVTGAIAWRVARRRAAGPWAVRLAPVIGGIVAAEFTLALILIEFPVFS